VYIVYSNKKGIKMNDANFYGVMVFFTYVLTSLIGFMVAVQKGWLNTMGGNRDLFLMAGCFLSWVMVGWLLVRWISPG